MLLLRLMLLGLFLPPTLLVFLHLSWLPLLPLFLQLHLILHPHLLLHLHLRL
jgi:hypothetical protein